jgi:hypothetical protein
MMKQQHARTEVPAVAGSKAIAAALQVAIPGFEVLEHGADLVATAQSTGVALRTDWVGKDARQRLHFVKVADGNDDETILWTLGALGIARAWRTTAPGAGSRWPNAAAAFDPLVVLIVRSCSARLLDALALLPPQSVALFESKPAAGRRRPALVRVDLRAAERADAPAGIEVWPARARNMAESLAARVHRIDPSFEKTVSVHGLCWNHHGAKVLALSLSDGRISGSWEGSDGRAVIDDGAGADAWLERALRLHCARLRSGPRVARPADLLARGGPLLSPEELAAFRDD